MPEAKTYYKEAITHYKTAIKIAPNFAKAYNNLGYALGEKGDIGAAITHYKTAIKIEPRNSIKAYVNLGENTIWSFKI